MKTIPVSDWDEFQQQIETIERQRELRMAEGVQVSRICYRGQSNSAWKLETTLDRYSPEPMASQEYFRKAAQIRSRLQTFTGLAWAFSLGEARNWTEDMPRGPMPGFAYLVFLRHHGFPSPLLDWTLSPQIAAFFAFRDVPRDAPAVSVYAFCEHTGSGKLRSSDAPSIIALGDPETGHPRHFLQQSQYTVCTVFRERTQYFASHDDAVVRSNQPGLDQDWLWKLNIPVSERVRFLDSLGQFNLNAFSLFGSTESLAETLAIEQFIPPYVYSSRPMPGKNRP